MRNIKQMALFVSLFFLVVVQAFAGEPPVTLRVADRFFSAPIGRSANVRLTAKVVRHKDNRNLDVSCNGDGDGSIYASSGKSLNGDKERETFDFAFDLLPAAYRCEAALKRVVNGKEKTLTSSVEMAVY